MALKSDRYELQTDISFFCNEATGRGGIVCHDSTAGSGAAMDQGVNLVVTKTTIANTDTPLGILLNDVTDKDLTRTHLNQHKDEVAKGGKVTILRKGYVVTNSLAGANPGVGDHAYAGDAGNIIASSSGEVPSSGALYVGRFLSTKDADGYAKVEVNLPAN